MTNLAGNLTKTAEKHPDRPAVRLGDSVLSYQELPDGAHRVAILLPDKGVGPGNRGEVGEIAIRGENAMTGYRERPEGAKS